MSFSFQAIRSDQGFGGSGLGKAGLSTLFLNFALVPYITIEGDFW